MPKRKGTIYQHRDKWRAMITIDGNRYSKVFDTHADADTWLTQQLAAHSTGAFIAPDKTTVIEWVAEWLETHVKPTVRTRTFERYLGTAKHLKQIADVPVQKLTGTQIQKLINDMSKTHSPSSVSKVLILLKAALNKAVQLGGIQRNPAIGCKAPKLIHRQVEAFTEDEIKSILRHTERNEIFAMAVQLALATGARIGEIFGLQWQDFDATKSTLHILRQVQVDNSGHFVIEEPKTRNSKRKISISEQTKKALLAFKLKHQHRGEWIISANNGNPTRQTTFDRYWEQILIDAGVEHKGVHTLRHTHATALIHAGTNIVEVSKRLGHSKTSVTLDIYAHVIEGNDAKSADKISEIFSV